jgi:hypothetical protein
VITHLFAIRRADLDARRFAGVKLREAFAPEIAKFSGPLNMIGSIEILEAAFGKRQIAVNEFHFHLRGKERSAFEKAWKDYCRAPDDQIDFSPYFGGDEERKDALARMEAIVAFTKK